MHHNKIHPEGPSFSRIVMGAWRWNLPTTQVERLIHASLDSDITTFDHADIYGDHSNEKIFGSILKSDQALRSKIELVTKCGIKFPSAKRPSSWVKHYDTSAHHIIWSVNNSLKNFGTDHIDLLLIHRPDPLLNPEEVATAFESLKKDGKVLYFGVSNFSTAQFALLQQYSPYPLVTNQIEVSLGCVQPMFDGTIDTLMKNKVSPMAWSPLGGGKLLKEKEKAAFIKAHQYKATDAQMALAWLLRHPSGIFPVIGTTKPERIIESARSIDIKLDLQDWFEMLKEAEGKEMP